MLIAAQFLQRGAFQIDLLNHELLDSLVIEQSKNFNNRRLDFRLCGCRPMCGVSNWRNRKQKAHRGWLRAGSRQFLR